MTRYLAIGCILALAGCGVAARNQSYQDYHQSLVAYRTCLASGSDCHTLHEVMDANRTEYNDLHAWLPRQSPNSFVWVNGRY
jgi:hypothetical protein